MQAARVQVQGTHDTRSNDRARIDSERRSNKTNDGLQAPEVLLTGGVSSEVWTCIYHCVCFENASPGLRSPKIHARRIFSRGNRLPRPASEASRSLLPIDSPCNPSSSQSLKLTQRGHGSTHVKLSTGYTASFSVASCPNFHRILATHRPTSRISNRMPCHYSFLLLLLLLF